MININYVTLFQLDQFDQYSENITKLIIHRENSSYWNDDGRVRDVVSNPSKFNLTNIEDDQYGEVN